MKLATFPIAVLVAFLALGCGSTSKSASAPPGDSTGVGGSSTAPLTIGIVWEPGASIEGRTGPYPTFLEVHWSGEIYLEAETLIARPEGVEVFSGLAGFPALSVTLAAADAARFEQLTRRKVDRPLAIFVEGEVVSIATINEPLPGNFVISGRFSRAQADELRRRLAP